MARFTLFLLCVLLVSVNAQFTSSTWTDSVFGGIFTLCVNGNTATGSYSNVGIIQGSIGNSGRSISGDFYDAGAGLYECTSGTFAITISSGGNSFTGSYTCADDDETYEWDENLIGGGSSVSFVNCAFLSTSSSVDGSFSSLSNSVTTDIDICVDDDEYEASYSYNQFRGYEYGIAFESGRVVSGIFQENDGVFGGSLFFKNSNDGLVNFFVTETGDDDDDHTGGSTVYTQTGNSSGSECARYDSLEIDDFDGLIDENSNSNNSDSSSSAWTLSVSIFSFFIILFAF